MLEATSIPDERVLREQERSLVYWMLEHGSPGAAQFLPQLAAACVVSRCPCGCASINFSVGGVVPTPGTPLSILADFEYRADDGSLCGAFVFAREGLLAGLEVWSVDGLSTLYTLPTIQQLEPYLDIDAE